MPALSLPAGTAVVVLVQAPVSVSTKATVTATFSVIPPPITVTVNKNGTREPARSRRTPAGIDCGGDCTGTYPGGTTVTLTPSADCRVAFCRLERRLYRHRYLSGGQHGHRDGDV